MKPDLNTKVARYYVARKKGNTIKESKAIAGYSTDSHTEVEKTKEYQKIARHFKDHLLEKITLDNIADELKKNILQDTDKGAKNNAIKLALEKVEPEQYKDDDDKNVLVVLKPVTPIEAEVEEVVEAETSEILEDDDSPHAI